jgi:preprotein translocase subunit SecG
MSVAVDRVDPLVLRLAWVVVALTVGIVLYRYVRADAELRNSEHAAVALSTAFLLSPTVRASAVYFITDGLAVHLAIVSLVLLRRARAHGGSPGFSALAILAAFASFYTRQYYLWVTLFVAGAVIFNATTRRAQVAAVTGCAVLSVPALALFSLWQGFTPPLGTPVHTQPMLLSTAPNTLGLLALYSLPLLWIAVRDVAYRVTRGDMQLSVPLCALAGIGIYVAFGTVLGLEIPRSGGVLSALKLLGQFGSFAFVCLSASGLLLLGRWLAVDGVYQLWWGVFLLPLLVGSIVLQRYFEPAIILVMFLALRPRDALAALDSRMVWYYPVLTAVYAVSRMIYFAGS